jgi:hypothetical protein
MKVYKENDLTEKFNNSVDKAKELWKTICKKNVEEMGDYGSCVVGAGIEISLIPKKCRSPRYKMIISSHEVSYSQGSVTWERGVKEVIDFLKLEDIDAVFNWGRMD